MPPVGLHENSVECIHGATAAIDRFLALSRCLPERTPELQTASESVLTELSRVGEFLSRSNLHYGTDRTGDIEAYRRSLEAMRDELPEIEQKLLAAQSSIVRDRRHLNAAAAWADTTKPIL